MGSRQQRGLGAKLSRLRDEQRVVLGRLEECRAALADIARRLGERPDSAAPEHVRVLPAIADNTVRAVVEVHRLGLEIADLERELASAGPAPKPEEYPATQI